MTTGDTVVMSQAEITAAHNAADARLSAPEIEVVSVGIDGRSVVLCRAASLVEARELCAVQTDFPRLQIQSGGLILAEYLYADLVYDRSAPTLMAECLVMPMRQGGEP